MKNTSHFQKKLSFYNSKIDLKKANLKIGNTDIVLKSFITVLNL